MHFSAKKFNSCSKSVSAGERPQMSREAVSHEQRSPHCWKTREHWIPSTHSGRRSPRKFGPSLHRSRFTCRRSASSSRQPEGLAAARPTPTLRCARSRRRRRPAGCCPSCSGGGTRVSAAPRTWPPPRRPARPPKGSRPTRRCRPSAAAERAQPPSRRPRSPMRNRPRRRRWWRGSHPRNRRCSGRIPTSLRSRLWLRARPRSWGAANWTAARPGRASKNSAAVRECFLWSVTMTVRVVRPRKTRGKRKIRIFSGSSTDGLFCHCLGVKIERLRLCDSNACKVTKKLRLKLHKLKFNKRNNENYLIYEMSIISTLQLISCARSEKYLQCRYEVL